jgi:predicted nucleic acid-binding protein
VSTGHALADTSVFIGLENARFDHEAMPASVSVSVITIAELRLGVLIASTVDDRARRMATLRLAESLEPVPIDDAAANAWATLVARLRDQGRKAPINDSWIAATAVAHDLPVLTQDGDFDVMPGVKTIRLASKLRHLMTGSLPLADGRASANRPAYARPVLPARIARATIAALAALIIAGCGSSGSPSVHGTNAGAALRAPGTLSTAATSSAPGPVRTDVPEPATAPPLAATPAGTVMPMPGSPEGLALDAKDGILAVGLRQPDGIALVNVPSGRVRGIVRLPGAPRHLQLAGPQGPVLVPAEQVGRLFQVSLPGGAVIANTKVGRQPHDAAAAGGTIFVGNEYSNTVSLVRGGRQVAVEPSPLQPGGVAAALDGSVVVVVGVRGRRIEAYAPSGRPLGSAPCGVGPTHVRAGPHNLFYVADTEGNQVLAYTVTAQGPRQVGAVPTANGAPYGIAVDPVRGIVYVTLTATNTLEAFRITGETLVPDGQWPTVRQPNDVAVDTVTGRVYVAGRDADQLEMLAGA